MTDTRVEGLLGLGWQQLRGRNPARETAGAEASLRTGTGHEVATRWWSRRTASEPQLQLAGESSLHVVSGELLEEQWCQLDEDGWRYSARRLRKGDGSTLAAGSIRRVAALRESCVVLVAEPGALGAIDAALWPVLRLARAAVIERAPEHTVVELSAPDPESIDEGDA